MKPKTLILMVVAVGCGLAASFMTSRVLSDRAKPHAEAKRVALLVAKRNLSVATMIKDPKQFFDLKLVEEGSDPKKAIKSGPVDPAEVDEALASKLYEQVKEHYLNKSLSEGQFVTQEDLRGKDEGGLGASMEKGMRAVTVKVDAAAHVGGFAVPNSRVDIVWVRRGGTNDSVAKTILQNVLVLAVDMNNVRPDDKQAMAASTVTLQVTPEQAEKLSLAVAMGELRLTLRAYGDDAVKPVPMVNLKSITNPGDADSASNPAEEDADGTSAGAGVTPPWANKIPDVRIQPAAPIQPAKEEIVKAPEPKLYVMTIHNGESVRKVRFALGENGEDGDTSFEVKRSSPERSAPKPPVKPAAPPATGDETK